MPAPFGPTIPIRSPRCAARNGAVATRCGSVAGAPSGVDRAAAGQVADDEVLDRGRRSRRTGPARRRPARRPGSRSLRDAFGASTALGLEALEPGLVLVHLAELAVAR